MFGYILLSGDEPQPSLDVIVAAQPATLTLSPLHQNATLSAPLPTSLIEAFPGIVSVNDIQSTPTAFIEAAAPGSSVKAFAGVEPVIDVQSTVQPVVVVTNKIIGGSL